MSQCHNKKDRQCHKKPVQSERKIPRTVCVPYEAVPQQEGQAVPQEASAERAQDPQDCLCAI